MKIMITGLISILGFILTTAGARPVIPWNIETLKQLPKTYEGSKYATNGVNAIFIEGESYQGKLTRIFAYYGIPKTASADHKVPGIVLVHGAGGSACYQWVQQWVDRGYAAISMDTCGCISGNGARNHARHEYGGPPGWGGFDQIDNPVTDQWTYHAVADVVRSHSFLRSMEVVDPGNIGVTGISWGGVLTCIAASIDDRFKFAAPVYGCGFLGDNSAWMSTFEKMGPVKSAKWMSLWDASVYLPLTKTPFLWVTGAKDIAFPMDSLQKSYNSVKSPVTLCIKPNMSHGQLSGQSPEEIYKFAQYYVGRNELPLPEITKVHRSGTEIKVEYDPLGRNITGAVLLYTSDSGVWKERVWNSIPATVVTSEKRVTGEIPAGTSVYYINLTTDDNMVVSTPHEEL